MKDVLGVIAAQPRNTHDVEDSVRMKDTVVALIGTMQCMNSLPKLTNHTAPFTHTHTHADTEW